MDLYMKIVMMVIGHCLVDDHFVVRAAASGAKQSPPAAAVANSPSKPKDTPNTVTSSSTTFPTTTTVQDRHVPEFKLAKIVCGNGGKCVFALQNGISRSLVAQSGTIFNTSSVKGWCSGIAEPTKTCCEELEYKFNARRPEYDPSDDYMEQIVNLMEQIVKLTEANCRLFCYNDTCSHVACKVPRCVQTTHSPSSSSPPLSTSSSSLTFPLTSDATNARDKGDGGKSQSTSIVIIVVTCVVAFLAGVGGAFIVICLRKRWKRSDGTSSARGVKDSGGVGLSELPRNPQLSATKTDVHTTASSNKNDYSTPTQLRDNEHIYNYITDHQPPTNHQPPATTTTTTTTTTKTPTSPYDNFRITPLPERKLPTAPTPPEPPHPPLAERPSRDKTARAGSAGTPSDYCLAKRPEVEREEVANRTGRGKQGGGKCSLDKPSPAADYFALEDDARKEDRLPMERDGRRDSEKETDTAQEPTGQYFTLEREEAEGEERNDDDDDDEGREHDGRERIISRASDSESYSPLDLSSARIEESEYTSLDLEEAETRGGEATRDYLDVVP